MIKRVLTDEIYIGTLITHKREAISIHKKPVKVNDEEQYRFENHHEAIISKEQFTLVQELRERRKQSTGFYTKKERDYIFAGFVRCGECKGGVTGLTRIRSKRIDYIPKQVYECHAYRKYGLSRCISHNIKEQYLLAIFKQFLVDIKQNYENELKSMNIETQKQNNKNKITILKENLTKANAEYKVLLSQKITEVSNSNNDNKDIIMNAYRELEQEKLLIIKSLEKNIEQLKYEKLEEKEHKLKTAIEYFTEIIESPKPSKAILSMVLDKIYIYNDKSIKIKLRIDIEHLLSNFDYVETA